MVSLFRCWGVVVHLGRQSQLLDLKAASQGLQKCPQDLQKCPKVSKKETKVVEKLFPNVARRTARSGLNSVNEYYLLFYIFNVKHTTP